MSKKSKQKQDDAEPKTRKEVIVEEAKFFAGLAVFLLLFFNFVFGHFKIPSESMQPTLEVGDHLFVSKLTYGASRESLIWPFRKLPLPDGRIFSKMPNRGDVLVFRNPKSGIIMIKRLVGLPGDKIQVEHGRLYINGKMVERTEKDAFSYREHRGLVQSIVKYEEQFEGEKNPHFIYERNDFYPLDNKGPFIIPPEKLFFMGDNRDNSEDSRAPGGPGFVPLDHVIGKAKMMVYSLKRCKKEEDLRCPPRRFFLKL
ncbi:MAG: signal peptidase I [Robiginitomaculum sp.]|nr:signal peptidase I [Robiginitomaculum sp.]